MYASGRPLTLVRAQPGTVTGTVRWAVSPGRTNVVAAGRRNVENGGVDIPDLAELLPDTPAGRQMKWFFRHSFSRGAELTVEEVTEHMSFGPDWAPQNGLKRFHESDERPFRVAAVKDDGPYQLTITMDYDDGKPWNATFSVEAEPLHRIIDMSWVRAIPDHVLIREAVPSDGPALNDLESRAPMVLGDVIVTYDRGDDFLAFARLMENNRSWVAEDDGKLLGFAAGCLHSVRIGGQVYGAMLLHHVRVPVEARGGGIFSAINQRVFAAHPTQQGAYGHTAVANAEGARLGGPGAWSFGFQRAVLDVASLAGPPHGRKATPADAPEIVEIINSCHDREEMFLPYTVASLTARLERAPELYTWDNVVMGDGAVLGVWPAGLKVTVQEGDDCSVGVRAIVIDYGFVADAEGSFERLVRSECRALLEQGYTELMILTSDGSPNNSLVCSLAGRMDPFMFRMSVPEPDGAEQRGLYIDAVYF